MLILKDRVKQIASAPVPTGTLTLGTTPNSYRSFSSVLSSGDETYYAIETSNSFEVGIGRYGIEGSNTLTRDTVLSSSTGSKLSLTGRATVFITVPAAKFPFVDPSGELNLSLNTLSDVSLTTPASGESLKYNGSSWVNGVVAGYTTEEAQDAVGGILADTSSISFSYNDGTPSISASVKNSGVTSNMLATGIDATKIGSGSVSSIEFGYLDGVTSSLQGQLDSKYDSANPSGYLTSSVASATYLPLAGGTLTGDLTLSSGLITTRTWTSGVSSVWSGTITPGSASASSTWINLVSGTTWGGTVAPSLSYTPYSGTLSFKDIWGGGTLEIGSGSGRTGMSSVFGVGLRIAPLGTTVSMRIGDHGEWGRNTQFENWHVNNSLVFTGTGFSGALSWDASHIFALRNSTNAQSMRIYETSTSSTSFGTLQIKANAGAAYQIGSAVGSAGGTNRAITFGHWNSGGTFSSSISVNTDGTLTFLGSYGLVSNNYNLQLTNTTSAAFAGTAFGFSASAGHSSTVAIGTNSTTTAAGQCVIGGNAAGITSVFIGNGVTHGTPDSVTYNATGGSGTNIAGANLILAGGKGTGTGTGGSLKFQVAPAGSSGSSANTLVDALIIDSTKLATFGGRITSPSLTPLILLQIWG